MEVADKDVEACDSDEILQAVQAERRTGFNLLQRGGSVPACSDRGNFYAGGGLGFDADRVSSTSLRASPLNLFS